MTATPAVSPRKQFLTGRPCEADRQYMVPPLDRLSDARRHVAHGDYVSLYGPPQSGKTTFLRHFARALTGSGEFAALYLSCEGAEAHPDADGTQVFLVQRLLHEAAEQLPAELQPPDRHPDLRSASLLTDVLHAWCRACPRRVVLLLDDIESLRGMGLIAVLRQLRAMFPDRPRRAVWSLVLCGVHDLREYRTQRASGLIGMASPFNIKAAALSLPPFGEEEVRALLGQHTAETGQPFEPAAIARIVVATGGHPGLVNALARELVEATQVSGPITVDHVAAAEQRLVLAGVTHLPALATTLAEPRVQRVLEPILSGEVGAVDLDFSHDVSDAVDLGLVRDMPLRLPNPLLNEMVPRALSARIQADLTLDPQDLVREDGPLDMARLLKAFASFWTHAGAALAHGLAYQQAAPGLVLMAFLQRVVDGRGVITRAFGIAGRRVDLLVSWPWVDRGGKRQLQREALELKVWRDGRKDPLAEGLTQIDAYLSGLGLDEGILVLFDQRVAAPPVEARTREEAAETATGKRIRVLRA